MDKRSFFFALLAVCSSYITALGQKPVIIKLDNPSFEDYPQAGHQPTGWFDCGFAGETPPDVNPTGQFKVSKNAFHGSTYLGMVTRDNNTWEAVGQRLKSPLLKGTTYTFSIFLARSEIYMSQSRATGRDVNYVTPATLRVWGGSGYCAKEEMLGETDPISAASWQKFSFKFTPKANHNYFMIEAFYKVPTLFPYNGNVLVDNASDIAPEIKKEEPKQAKVEPTKPKVTPPTTKQTSEVVKLPTISIAKPVNKANLTTPSVELRATALNVSDMQQISVYFNGVELSEFSFDKASHLVKANLKLNEGDNTITIKVKNKDGENTASTTCRYTAPALTSEVPDNNKLKEGSIIKIEKLQFAPNSSEIEKESFSSLDAIYTLLAANPNMVVEIGGHTNLIIEEGLSLRLSLNRAKAVADYLVGKGIDKKRLVAKGYGRNHPIENNTTQAANKVNQRVEIKILSTNG
ncbi:MAG: OmpA family protein [Saprospiraceae bacterium]|nr:OmpA family protein [Saprospiraceae bacterium]